MNYTIGDFIIRLKNASLARQKEVAAPFSNINLSIGKALTKEGFLDSAKVETIEGHKILIAVLRYHNRRPVLTDVALVSKPSLRVYLGSGDILRNQGRARVSILSTNQGILTGKEAVKKKVGGELLFKVW